MPGHGASGAMTGLVLHDYWRSSASYRVRIALALKGIDYAQVSHDLRLGEQRSPEYVALAPHGLVPAIEHDGTVLIESLAIIEWIEARWPEPPLLPATIEDAARVRAICALIACDIHPLNNLRVLDKLRSDFAASDEQVRAWIAHWIGEGFSALERLVGQHGGRFAFGDRPTLADCCLVPQVYNAQRFGISLAPFPRIAAANAAMLAVSEVAQAYPDMQAGALSPGL
jgi:maleylpyruvate isomerase